MKPIVAILLFCALFCSPVWATDLEDLPNTTNMEEFAQDAVGSIIIDHSTIDFTYNDGANTITGSVINDTNIQKVEVVKNSGAVVGTRKQLNFIEGSNITLTIADDVGNNQVDITIASSGGGGGGCTVPGSDTQIIFNDGGACGADAGLTYNKTLDNLMLNAGVPGTDGEGVFALGEGVAPTTAPTGTAQIFGVGMTWTDTGNTDTALGIILPGLDGNFDPTLIHYRFGQQFIVGGTEENTRSGGGMVVNLREHSGDHIALKSTGSLTHGITTLADTDTLVHLGGGSNGSFQLESFSDGSRALQTLGTVTTEVNAFTNGSSAIALYGTLKSGTSRGDMSAGKALLHIYKGLGADDIVWQLSTDGNVRQGPNLYLNSCSGGGGCAVADRAKLDGGALLTIQSDTGASVHFWSTEPASALTGVAQALLFKAGGEPATPVVPPINHAYLVFSPAINQANTTGLRLFSEDGARYYIGGGSMGGDRNYTAPAEAGQALIVKSESASPGSTNKNAGTLKLQSGPSTGSGTGTIEFLTSPAGGSGTLDRSATLKWSISGAGALIGHGSTSGTVSISPPATITSYSMVLPSTQSGAGECLSNDGSGNLSWAACSGGGGGTPGGSNTQVQFNDGGAFGGDAGLTYNKTTDVLTASGGFVGGLTGNASTATALAANGANCSTGQAPLGVDASGAAESCTDYMEEPGSSGLVARTAANTSAARTITGTANQIVVTNGDGVSGNPTIDVGTQIVQTDQNNTYSTGTQDFGSATALKLPTASGPTPTSDGHIAFDSARDSLVWAAHGATVRGCAVLSVQTSGNTNDSSSGSGSDFNHSLTYALPAGWLNATGKYLEIEQVWKITTGSSAPTLGTKLKLGSGPTTLFEVATLTAPTSNVTNRTTSHSFRVVTSTTGASGEVIAAVIAPSQGNTAFTAGSANSINQPVGTFDLTASQTITHSSHWGSAGTGTNTIQLLAAIVKGCN